MRVYMLYTWLSKRMCAAYARFAWLLKLEQIYQLTLLILQLLLNCCKFYNYYWFVVNFTIITKLVEYI
jgi:hypothetical protein